MDNTMVPLRNFCVVDEKRKIYRSAQPQYSYEYRWLNTELQLKNIVNLRSELDHDTKMAKNYDIKVKTVSVPDHHAPTVEQANDFIKNNESVLFHCEHGQGRTSTFCVLSRLATGWTLEDAIKEENDVYGYSFHHPEQLKFLQDNFSNYNK